MTLAAVLCCALATTVQAQDLATQALKDSEKKVKLAEKNPKNGRLQYEAALSLINDDLGEKKDLDRAIIYANRALKIAQEHPAPQDTLLGLSNMALGIIYMNKQDMANSMNYMESAMEAFTVELGRHDPITNGNKLIFSMMMAASDPSRGFPKVLEAFYNNGTAPEDKRIENMDEANIALEMALEMLIAQQTERFRYALPLITIEGQQYLIVQTTDWNMERPLVGWQVSSFMSTDDESEDSDGNETIICDTNGNFSILPDEKKDQRQLMFNFRYLAKDPRRLIGNEGDARIWFLNPDVHKELLARFREYIASQK